MTSCYKQTEKELQKIIQDNIKPSKNTSNIKLRIYYKNRKLKNLFIKNNPNKPKDPFNVVFMYTCDQAPCTGVQATYIGHTTTTISERMKQHTSIKKHYKETHQMNITGSKMIPNITILSRLSNKQDLIIKEALLIKQQKPAINIQANDFNRTLKIFQHRSEHL